ncbi:unnamed protein product [Rhizophagus irregularis]|uniref:Uncharacterized protein n=1 Tax=Rhizophagus irregularis TaxID=588596 RepID=A0A2I1HGE4_9GLOM|nr:hypothetical protein RhiirA4_479300 [Rhizophagus irregularis]CAB4426196.1 unnamed protein product [Rhizophagus irregularis]CAB4446596.1 unnamed protein product [Rhizophagus irregularis]
MTTFRQKTIVDIGAAICAISKGLLKETRNEIERSSNVRCIMANGSKIASLEKSTIEIEINEITTEIEVEVINLQDIMLIIGYKIYIPIEYIKSNRIKLETPIQDDPIYEDNEEVETFRVEDLEEEYISKDEEKAK